MTAASRWDRKSGPPDGREFAESSSLLRIQSLQLHRHEVSCSCWNLAGTTSFTGSGERAVARTSETAPAVQSGMACDNGCKALCKTILYYTTVM